MDLFTKLGLQNIPYKEKFKFFCEFSETLQKIAIAIALENMSKNDLEKFKNLIANKAIDDTFLLEFILTRVPNFEIKFKLEVEKFYNDILACNINV